MKQNLTPWYLALIGTVFSITTPNALATAASWNSATTSGSWSLPANWSTGSAPTTSDTATLADATANRTIYYDTAASGALNTLTITENSGYNNQLTLYRNLSVTNAISLGSSSGTSALVLDSSLGQTGTFGGTTVALTASGGITINSGGLLGLVVGGTANAQNTITGNIAVSGGQLVLYRAQSSNAGTTTQITGNLTMSSGTLAIAAAYGSYANVTNNRLFISGTVGISGGAINNQGGGNIRIGGNTIVINDVTFTSGTAPAITLTGGGNQSFTSNVAWSAGTLSAFGISPGNNSGNAIKSVGSSVTGGTLTVGWIQMSAGNSGTATLRLTSDITSIGSNSLNAQAGASGGTFALGIDANGHTLDLSANTSTNAAWTLSGTASGGSSKVIWVLSNSAGTSAIGKIKTQAFDFMTTGSTGAGISVGSYVTLESTGTNGTNNLSSVAGTIDATSTFLYSGSASAAAPENLTSTRNIGNLTVTKGVLKVTGTNLVAAGAVTVDAGGTLDLSSYSVTAGNGLVLGSGTASGYIKGSNTLLLSSTSGDAVSASLVSGTIASVLSSGTALSSVTKTNAATTVTLLGNNTYLGATNVNAGILAFNSAVSGTGAQALGSGNIVNLGVAATSSGTLQYTGAAGTLSKNVYALGTGLNTIKNSGTGLLTLAGSLVKNGTILALNGGTGGINVTGVISGTSANSDLYVTGGTTTLSNVNTYNGPTYVYGDAVLINGIANSLPTGTTLILGGADNTTGTFDLGGNAQSVTGLASQGTGANVVTNNGTADATLNVSGTGGNFGGTIKDGLHKTALTLNGGNLILGGNNSYTGDTTVSSGTLSVNGSLGSSAVNVASAGTLSGSGSVAGTTTVTGGTVNGDGLTLAAANFSGVSTVSGTTKASNVTVTSGTTFNQGSTSITNVLGVNIGAILVNTGSVSAASVTVAATGHLTNHGTVTATNVDVGGLLSGNGTINAALTITSGGELNGRTTVNGSLAVNSGAKVSLQLESLSNHDEIVVSNGVSLSGNLTLTLSDAFLAETSTGSSSESIILVDNTSAVGISHAFDTISYITTSGTYAVTGDTFTVGSTQYRISYTGGDGNDLALTVVPEPGTWAMLVGGVGMLLGAQRMRRMRFQN